MSRQIKDVVLDILCGFEVESIAELYTQSSNSSVERGRCQNTNTEGFVMLQNKNKNLTSKRNTISK